MSLNYAYNYVEIDPATNMCIGLYSRTLEHPNLPENWVQVPVNDDDYIGKYYINGEWYEDAEGTIPWQSDMLSN